MKKVLTVCLLLVGGALLLSSCASTKSAEFTAKRNVDGVRGYLEYHPDRWFLSGKDGKNYSLFYDYPNKTLFISTNDSLYDKFANYLPVQAVAGRRVLLEGPTINPLTIFSKEQLTSEGRKVGIDLNAFKVATIFGYSLIDSTTPVPIPPKVDKANQIIRF